LREYFNTYFLLSIYPETSSKFLSSFIDKKPIEQVLKEHTEELVSIRGVVGTAHGLCVGAPCIKVFVSRKTEKLEQKIPKNLEGYQVVIQETGKFKALPDN
jgi:hypothetical protein